LGAFRGSPLLKSPQFAETVCPSRGELVQDPA
jgi:hypothetical protein